MLIMYLFGYMNQMNEREKLTRSRLATIYMLCRFSFSIQHV